MYTWDPKVESYRGYLSRKSYLGEITGSMDRVRREIREGIDDQTASIIGSNEAIAASLSADLDHLASTFNWGFSQVLVAIGGMADSIQQLVRIAKTPTQTAAYEHFDLARDSFRKGLLEECLDELGKAISGDHVSSGFKTEWRFHHLLGVVRLGSFAHADPDIVDLPAAEEAFLLAARYARADQPREAARALLAAGFAAYAQSPEAPGKLADALQHTEAALALDGNLSEALFQLAKLQMALDRPADALPALRGAIDREPGFVLRAGEDPDHRRHGEAVRDFLAALRQEKLRGLLPMVEKASTALAEGVTAAPEIRDHAAIARWRAIEAGARDWGLIELARYAKGGLAADVSALHELVHRLASEVRVSFERKKVSAKRTVSIDEPYTADETYWEEVLVRPGSWWRTPKYDTVQKTRQVRKTRTVQREQVVEEERVEVVLRNGLGHEKATVSMVAVRAGRFRMGSPLSDSEAYGDERPAHDVTLTRGFLMWPTPMTQDLYEALTGGNPSGHKGPRHPVENVSWFDAVAFCNKLSQAMGLDAAYAIHGESVTWKGLAHPGWRLPTEAEWEYACRAGSTASRYFPLDEVAWYDKNSGGHPHPVGGKRPNAWGLYDTLGNVREWCWDWKGDYPSAAVTDPTGPSSGSYRVYRGGSWYSGAWHARAAIRDGLSPSRRDDYLGFRPVRSSP